MLVKVREILVNLKGPRDTGQGPRDRDFVFLENDINNVLISMNLSLCQISFNTLVSFLGCTYEFLSRPRNFTKIKYA